MQSPEELKRSFEKEKINKLVGKALIIANASLAILLYGLIFFAIFNEFFSKKIDLVYRDMKLIRNNLQDENKNLSERLERDTSLLAKQMRTDNSALLRRIRKLEQKLKRMRIEK